FKFAFNKDGLVNQILWASGLMEPVSNALHAIGLQGQADQPIYWFDQMYNGNLARSVVLLVNLWLGAPYHMMMITGCLTTISQDLYEAAEIDGASSWHSFKAITLPSVLQATMPSLIMTFSFNFNNFGAIYFLTGGGPSYVASEIPQSMRIMGAGMPGQTDILISWIYKLSFSEGSEIFNMGAVYSIFIFLVVGGFAVYSMQRSKSFSEDM
ncbi:MAG TPA: ABC transporter permease subunit, partial [Treponemataceae bacterium]|nr:ABC transporter permease subunit [Treponemataceae bacterium]